MVIIVRSEQVSPPSKGQVLPLVHDYKTHVEVTKGKPWGFTGVISKTVTAAINAATAP
jgi:hypothetical protein